MEEEEEEEEEEEKKYMKVNRARKRNGGNWRKEINIRSIKRRKSKRKEDIYKVMILDFCLK